MKIYKTLLLVALLPILMISCSKSNVRPTAKPVANTKTTQDTIYASGPAISGPIGSTIPDPALAGNWTLVSDSTSHIGGEKPEFDSGAKYIGQSGDYFNIANNGIISMKEGSNYQAIDCVETNSGTNSFELLHTQYPNVAIAGGGFIHAQLLSLDITAHSAVVTSQMIGTMGFYTRQFVLER